MNGRLENELKTNTKIEKILEGQPKYLHEWKDSLLASRKTSATIQDYLFKIKKYLQAVDYDINQGSTVRYFISIQTKNKKGNVVKTSDSYQQTIWCCLNNFFSFMVSMGYLNKNYMEMIEKPKNHDLDRINENRILLTKKDFTNIINAINKKAGDSYLRDRDLAIMSLFMTTGMRKSALVDINIEDVDFDDKELVVIDKGNKRHKYALSDSVLEILNNWMGRRDEIDLDTPALFISSRKQRLSADSVDHIVDKYAREALGKHISPHKLRAGVCSIVYDETKDIEFTRRVIGHSNVATTQRYIVTNNDEREKASDFLSSVLK